MAKSNVYLAGVGHSPLKSDTGSSSNSHTTSLISAATKALLDAGVTYDDVSYSVASKGSKSSVEAFQRSRTGEASVEEAEKGREFEKSFCLVSERGAKCVLMVGAEKVRSIDALSIISAGFGASSY
jgi:hypothetical protein